MGTNPESRPSKPGFDATEHADRFARMNASQIIQEISSLSPDEQAKVVRFAYSLDAERRLSGPELSALAARMVATTDPAETARLRAEITRGFYGSQAHA